MNRTATTTGRNFRKSSVKTEALTELLRQAAQELQLLAAETSLVEKEIAEFNRFYYSEVGPLYEEYRELQKIQEYTSGMQLTLPSNEEAPAVTDVRIAEFSRKIYRRMAKICHPDTKPTAHSAFFIKLHDAYRSQDLGGLLLLEQKWRATSGKQADNKNWTEEQLDMIDCAKMALINRKTELLESPAYRLRQKIFWAKMGGQDLLAQIKRHLKQQIAQAKLAA